MALLQPGWTTADPGKLRGTVRLLSVRRYIAPVASFCSGTVLQSKQFARKGIIQTARPIGTVARK